MGIIDSFLKTAGDLLTMSSGIKRMDSCIDKLTEENRSLDRRLMTIEVMVEISPKNTSRAVASRKSRARNTQRGVSSVGDEQGRLPTSFRNAA